MKSGRFCQSRCRAVFVTLSSLLLASATICEVSAQEINFAALAQRVVDRMQLEPGERVLVVAGRGRFDAIVPAIARSVEAKGARYLGAVSVEGAAPSEWETDFTRQIAGLDRRRMAAHFQDVDVAVMLPGADASHLPYLAMQDVLRGGQSRTIHFHWTGAYDLNGNPLPNTGITDVLYERAVLTTNYASLGNTQAEFEDDLRNTVVRVTTPEGTDISFQIGDRPVTRQDGDASGARAIRARNLIDREVELPAGAIRVAPVEETVRGTIVFPDGLWNDVRVTGLTMHFVNGRVVEMEAESGIDAVRAELDAAGPAARSFREFALGFNPLIPLQARGTGGWIPYYGYGAGVVRLSLGDNTELGGKVSGGYVRWNFFPNATVIVGGKVWVREGRLQ